MSAIQRKTHFSGVSYINNKIFDYSIFPSPKEASHINNIQKLPHTNNTPSTQAVIPNYSHNVVFSTNFLLLSLSWRTIHTSVNPYWKVIHIKAASMNHFPLYSYKHEYPQHMHIRMRPTSCSSSDYMHKRKRRSKASSRRELKEIQTCSKRISKLSRRAFLPSLGPYISREWKTWI